MQACPQPGEATGPIAVPKDAEEGDNSPGACGAGSHELEPYPSPLAPQCSVPSPRDTASPSQAARCQGPSWTGGTFCHWSLL